MLCVSESKLWLISAAVLWFFKSSVYASCGYYGQLGASREHRSDQGHTSSIVLLIRFCNVSKLVIYPRSFSNEDSTKDSYRTSFSRRHLIVRMTAMLPLQSELARKTSSWISRRVRTASKLNKAAPAVEGSNVNASSFYGALEGWYYDDGGEWW